MKLLFTFILFTAISVYVNAIVHIVTCQNTPAHFLPITVYAEVGDTIHWTWIAGGHIVGPLDSTHIPAGASMFNAPIDVSHQSFEYVVTQVGSYDYECHPANPHGEQGNIEVSPATGLNSIDSKNKFLSLYPNPSNGRFQLLIDNLEINKNCKVEIRNLKGQIIYQTAISSLNTDIDLSNHANGIYFMEFQNGESILTKTITIQ